MIKLEALQKEDFKKIIQWNENKSADFLLQWSGPLYKYPLTKEQLQKYFDDYVYKEAASLFVYKIIDAKNEQMIGTVELDVRDSINKEGRVSRFLIGEENLRGKSYGREALKELVRIGFEQLQLNKITLGVFDFNITAIKCYKSAGFNIEGLKENYRKAEKGYWNLYDMAITKKQWEAAQIKTDSKI